MIILSKVTEQSVYIETYHCDRVNQPWVTNWKMISSYLRVISKALTVGNFISMTPIYIIICRPNMDTISCVRSWQRWR